jgi:Uma2 family endonuclease
MPYAAPRLPESLELFPNRIRWTKSQCRAMREAGILTDRYELIDGEIISKMGQNPPHAYAVRILIAWLTQLFGALHVQCQLPISVAAADPDHNEPEPDAAVTIGPAADFAARHPGPADLLLVAEVADTTLRSDRIAKAALYARAGIREYWIVDIAGRQLLVHRQPGANGYEEVTLYSEGELAATQAQPGASILVTELLPPTA